jgi:hypothetical protein
MYIWPRVGGSPDSQEEQVGCEGLIAKRSEWLRQWNVREAGVIWPADIARPGVLIWRGGAVDGGLRLDGKCVVGIKNDELIVRRGRRRLHFRAVHGGPALDEWFEQMQQAIPLGGTPGYFPYRIAGDRPPQDLYR